jgi:Zinc knuckle
VLEPRSTQHLNRNTEQRELPMAEQSGGAGTGSGGTTTDASSLTTNRSSGRGRGRNNRRGGRGGRSSGRHHSNDRRQVRAPPKKPFTGKEEALKSHVYDITDPGVSASTFRSTTREVAEFAGRTYKMGNHVKRAIEQLKPVMLTKPVAPTPATSGGTVDQVDQDIYREDIKAYAMDKRQLANSMQMAYSLILGQCSEGVRAKIESAPNHEALQNAGDPIGLLLNIQSIMFNHQTSKYLPHAIHESLKSLYQFEQDSKTAAPEYYRLFKDMLNVVEHNGGTFGKNEGAINACLRDKNIDPDKATDAQKEQAEIDAKGRAEAVAFLLGADEERYGKLVEDLENSFTQGDNRYPKDLTDAYKLLVNWKQEHRTVIKIIRGGGTNASSSGTAEVAFTNVGAEQDQSGTTLVTMGVDGREFPNIRCYNCQKHGHYADQCPEATTQEGGTQLLMNASEEGTEDEQEDDVYLTFNFAIKGQMTSSQEAGSSWTIRVQSTYFRTGTSCTISAPQTGG